MTWPSTFTWSKKHRLGPQSRVCLQPLMQFAWILSLRGEYFHRYYWCQPHTRHTTNFPPAFKDSHSHGLDLHIKSSLSHKVRKGKQTHQVCHLFPCISFRSWHWVNSLTRINISWMLHFIACGNESTFTQHSWHGDTKLHKDGTTPNVTLPITVCGNPSFSN